MRRALITTAATAAGLAALLSYKSSGAVKLQKVSFAPSAGSPATSTLPPTSAATTTPTQSTGAPTTAPPTAAPPTTAPPTTAPPTTAAARRTYSGQLVQYFYGDIQVDIGVQGGKLVNLTVPQNGAVDGHSQAINSYAVPILEQEALSAQGLNFNAVSGATFTSDAFAQSLQSALQKAGL